MEAWDPRGYAAKMRGHVLSGTDLEADVRFIDMLVGRQTRVLDIGCGIGNAVAALRRRGHEAFGVDPTDEVLQVAAELYGTAWFRTMQAGEVSLQSLRAENLPTEFDVILMSGNVPAFFSCDELGHIFHHAHELLHPGGQLVIGTTVHTCGGPVSQDSNAENSALRLDHRYADWHLSEFRPDSKWSVSVFTAAGTRPPAHGPDGIFILPPA